MKPLIVLASASPRRKELMEEMGLDFIIRPAEGEESSSLSDPGDMVAELAANKAGEVFHQFSDQESVMVIGADTVVVKDGQILGKPHSEYDAQQMLCDLSDATHQVYTGVAIIFRDLNRIRKERFYDKTDVTFRTLSMQEITNYILTGEPMDKAGAYGIQGFAGEFVKKINGDFNNVVGLPTARLREVIHQLCEEV